MEHKNQSVTHLPDIGAMLKLNGIVAAVTGGAEGIGAQIVKHLAAAGAYIAILDRNKETGDKEATCLSDYGCHAKSFAVDITNEQIVVKTFEDILSEFGRLDILINNAGIQN